eukprot:gb/GEZN01029570.1/.p1 GENE.gb/GEZN01029570.1/~~gb/GEZN01029570.1/.p1  ORF type:complete len:145 (-),score=7.08 gb/GEZN01029570.1/:28-432(-)
MPPKKDKDINNLAKSLSGLSTKSASPTRAQVSVGDEVVHVGVSFVNRRLTASIFEDEAKIPEGYEHYEAKMIAMSTRVIRDGFIAENAEGAHYVFISWANLKTYFGATAPVWCIRLSTRPAIAPEAEAEDEEAE